MDPNIAMSISVIGLGFVGLTTALGFAEKGVTVIGYDRDTGRRSMIGSGVVPFHEPGLTEALHAHLGTRFRLADSLESAVADSDTVFLCVGTPSSPDGQADLSAVRSAVDDCLRACTDDVFRVLVIKSTVPPGSTRQISADVEKRLGPQIFERFGFAANPEFLREGHSWADFLEPDRILIGTDEGVSHQRLLRLYSAFPAPVLRLTTTEAEFVKYLSNTLLATLISFANETATLAERVGDIDIARSFAALHLDKRWNGSPAAMADYVYPGCGFGGYCLPKDTQALAHLAAQVGAGHGLLDAVLVANRQAKESAVTKIVSASRETDVIGIFGLSFKPGSDDVRESPSADIIRGLIGRGRLKLIAHDPMAINAFRSTYELPIEYATSATELLNRADILVLATAWKEYQDLLPTGIGKRVVDLRHCLTSSIAKREQAA